MEWNEILSNIAGLALVLFLVILILVDAGIGTTRLTEDEAPAPPQRQLGSGFSTSLVGPEVREMLHRQLDFIVGSGGRLNARQRYAIVAGIALIVLMALFPPWLNLRFGQGFVFGVPAGYSFILYPPGEYASLDIGRLLVQWAAVCLVVGGLVWLWKDTS